MTAEYQPLSAVSLIGSVTISVPPTNVGNTFFRGDDGSDVFWPRCSWQEFKSVDLSKIFVKGAPGDVITVIGGTWG